MKSNRIRLALLTTVSLALLNCADRISAQGTGFTYQGRLLENGTNASGIYDLRFTIYDTGGINGGNVIAGPLLLSGVPVSSGLLVTNLDFGTGVFTGNARWLEIGVRSNGSAAVYQLLLPRQSITATPYAIQAAGLSGALPDSQLSANVARLNGSNAFTGPVTFGPASGSPFAIAGSSSNKVIRGLNADQLDGLDSAAFWKTGGNPGTSNGVHYLGTTDNKPLELRAGGGVGVGTPNPRDKIHIADGSLRITGSGPVFDPSATGLRLGGGPNGQNGSSWIQSWDGPLALNPHANNVGIGTANPESALHVEGADVRFVRDGHPLLFNANAGQAGTRAEIGSGLALAFAAGNVERLRIDTNGNVGIGTTMPNARFEVADGGWRLGTRSGGLFSGGLGGGFNANNNVYSLYFRDRDDVNYNDVFMEANSWKFTSSGNQNTALKIDPNGNVGIGTTSPREKLDVRGDVVVGTGDDFVNNKLVIRGPNEPLNSGSHQDLSFEFSTAGSAKVRAYRGNSWDTYLELLTTPNSPAGDDPQVRMHINSVGNVGIGTTDPMSKLHLKSSGHTYLSIERGAESFEGGIQFWSLGAPKWQISLDDAGTSQGNDFQINASGEAEATPRMRFPYSNRDVLLALSGGNVGIGTTTPAERLRIVGPGTSATILALLASDDTGRLRIDYNGSVTAVGTDGNTRLDLGAAGFSANSTIPNALTLLPNGNVGIGATAPSTRLQVVNATCNGSSWINASDRELKDHFEEVGSREVLEKLIALPITKWRYIALPNEKHIGPVAQDFQAAFGVGADDKHISTVDADGVALAAIQGLNQKLEEQVREKDTQIAELKNRLTALEQLITKVIPSSATSRP